MKRQTGTRSLAGMGSRRWRDWLPARGLVNPCYERPLPAAIADHPAVAGALERLDLGKVWDCHVHLVGVGDSASGDLWVDPALDSLRHPLQFLQKRFYLNASCVSGRRKRAEGRDRAYCERLRFLMEPDVGMRLLLLAFDYSYDETGRRRADRSTFYVSNRYAQAVAASHPRWEWAASIHPYRADALDALDWAAAHGARAVKWLPPAMGMDPASPRCDPFYDALQRLNLPLLTHGGHERAVRGGGRQALGNPLRLRRALERGVRVIMAHCASLGTATDLSNGDTPPGVSSNFGLFLHMMRERAFEGLLYGDLSAVTQVNRAPEALKTLLAAEDIQHRLLHGSDYPLPGILPLFSRRQLLRLGLIDPESASVVFEIQKYNPLLFDLVLKRNLSWQGHRFPCQVFETADFFGPGPLPRA